MQTNNLDNIIKIYKFKAISQSINSTEFVRDSFNSLIFIYNGSISLIVANKRKNINNTTLVLAPYNICYKINLSNNPQNKLYIITFHTNIFLNQNVLDLKLYFKILNNSTIKYIQINTAEINLLKTVFKLVYYSHKTPFSQIENDVIKVILNFFSLKCTNSNTPNTNKTSNKTKILYHFFDLIIQDVMTFHQVSYYANKLCITSGYLNKITKELVDISAKKLIDNALLIQSKILLNNQSLTINDIAFKLNFSSISAFTKFFKQHTSHTPSEFRNIINKNQIL